MSRPAITLIAMPWATTTRPSLALSTLAARLRDCDLHTEVVYANLLLSTIVGSASYEFMTGTPAYFGIAEHFFAAEVFSRDSLRSDEYLRNVARPVRDDGIAPLPHQGLLQLRDLIAGFLDVVVREILALETSVVGLTCTFNQVMPSIALAKALKAQNPSIHTVLGGACVHGDMGATYSGIFQPYIDCVFLGEADHTLPRYVDHLFSGRDVALIPGLAVAGRRTAEGVPTQNLDDLPIPDFGDYFGARDHLKGAGFALAESASLPFEASRGCWWGQKEHCTFCGLNTTGMAFRRKSAARVVREIQELSERYGADELMAADNILDFRAYNDLLPRLTALPRRPRLFFELKANVSRDDVAALSAAGVTWVQPGFESFSDHVLGLMRKGTPAMQNIAVLKWLSEFGIRTSYNLLVGFPGETSDDYADILRVIDKITHLPPPGTEAHIVQVQRFSPFHFASECLGIGPITGAAYYEHLIPRSVANPDDYAYFFDRQIPPAAPLHKFLGMLNERLASWCQSSRTLNLKFAGRHLELVADGVPCERLTPLESASLIAADAPISIRRIQDKLKPIADGSTIQAALWALESRGLLFIQRGHAVTLIPFFTPTVGRDLQRWFYDRNDGPKTPGLLNDRGF